MPRRGVLANEKPWTKKELADVKAELLADRDRLASELAATESGIADLVNDSGEGAGDDVADAGSKTFEREQEMSIADNARDLLLQTDKGAAADRSGTWVRVSRGGPIGKARLQAFPRATLCLECKTAGRAQLTDPRRVATPVAYPDDRGTRPDPAQAAPDESAGVGDRRSLLPITILVAVLVLALDQFTSGWLAVTYLEGRASVEVIGPALKLTFVRNPGAAFSLGGATRSSSALSCGSCRRHRHHSAKFEFGCVGDRAGWTVGRSTWQLARSDLPGTWIPARPRR